MQRPKKVMIADDDFGIIDSMSIMLEFGGYEVSSTINGKLLLQMEQELPDLLLLDIWMSGVDGRDICRKLKNNKITSKMPILMMSASKNIEHSALQAGADDFLSKPFEMEDLLKKIAQNIL